MSTYELGYGLGATTPAGQTGEVGYGLGALRDDAVVTTEVSLTGVAATASAGSIEPPSAYISWAEFEAPNAFQQAFISWAEFAAPQGSSVSLTLTGAQAQALAGVLVELEAANIADLAGVAATVAAGTLAPVGSVALAGNAVTASAGALEATNQVYALAGTLTPSAVPALAGEQATASAGSLSVETDFAEVTLAGAEAVTAVGVLTHDSTSSATVVDLIGAGVTSGAGTIANGTVTVELTGVAVTGSVGALGGPRWTPVPSSGGVWTPVAAEETEWEPA